MRRLKSKILELHRGRGDHDADGGRGSVVEMLQDEVLSFPSISEAGDAFTKCFDSFGKSKVLLIGDGTHGTSEFYRARAEITKYMIENHGFTIVAVEADWPDAEAVDRYTRRREGPGKEASVEPAGEAIKAGREPAFMRFPTWMWRNMEVRDFVEWLRSYNQDKDVYNAESVAFYGLDLYSLGASMRAVIEYLDTVDRDMADQARDKYGDLLVWAENPEGYGLESLVSSFEGYEAEVVKMLEELLSKRMEYSKTIAGCVEFHSGEQNAQLVKDAEQYFKAMFYGHRESWNLRDTHMFETLLRNMDHRGPSAKAIVWAHNSHIGDARASSKGWARNELSIGQLCKEKFGAQALSIGCCSYRGRLAAAEKWGEDMKIMEVRRAMSGSYEELMHDTGIKNFVLDLREGKCSKELRKELEDQRLQRFIGAIYKPDDERKTHYSFTVLPKQLDGLVWLDSTRHVGALEVHQPQRSAET